MSDAYKRGMRDAAQQVMEHCAERQKEHAQSRDRRAVFSQAFSLEQGRCDAFGETMAFAAGIYDEADQ